MTAADQPAEVLAPRTVWGRALGFGAIVATFPILITALPPAIAVNLIRGDGFDAPDVVGRCYNASINAAINFGDQHNEQLNKAGAFALQKVFEGFVNRAFSRP